MTKKSLVVILGLSVIIWFISALFQGFLGTVFNFNPLNGGCQITGYPLALCINSYEGIPIKYYLLNVGIWFIILFGIKRFLLIKKRKK